MPSLTVENYVKAILQIGAEHGGSPVATGQIATALNVSPGTVTSMLKTLSESSLITYAPYEGARLTAAGNALALRMVRRHRLIELFLSRTLDLTWDEVHEEAEHMEHAVSDRLIDRIESHLNFPEVDPHGDPIPKADGSVRAAAGRSLAACQAGEVFRLIRVVDQSPGFLRFLTESGIRLGASGQVQSNRIEAGLIRIQLDNAEVSLGHEAAEKLVVERQVG